MGTVVWRRRPFPPLRPTPYARLGGRGITLALCLGQITLAILPPNYLSVSIYLDGFPGFSLAPFLFCSLNLIYFHMLTTVMLIGIAVPNKTQVVYRGWSTMPVALLCTALGSIPLLPFGRNQACHHLLHAGSSTWLSSCTSVKTLLLLPTCRSYFTLPHIATPLEQEPQPIFLPSSPPSVSIPSAFQGHHCGVLSPPLYVLLTPCRNSQDWLLPLLLLTNCMCMACMTIQ